MQIAIDGPAGAGKSYRLMQRIIAEATAHPEQNYLLIVTTLVGITAILTDSTLSSVGNSVAVETKEKNFRDFRAFQLLFMWIVGCVCACMCGLYQPFIRFWIGAENLLSQRLMLVFVVYFFTERMGNVCFQYRQAAGLWSNRTILAPKAL